MDTVLTLLAGLLVLATGLYLWLKAPNPAPRTPSVTVRCDDQACSRSCKMPAGIFRKRNMFADGSTVSMRSGWILLCTSQGQHGIQVRTYCAFHAHAVKS